MQYFWEWAVKPMLYYKRARKILEIGASLGHNTYKILKSFPDAKITVIDPCLDLDLDLAAVFEHQPRVSICKGNSLDMLPVLSDAYDAILIDGDHNYYTVYNELKLIAERNLLAPNGVIFLHDIGPPYGRKDMFYQPSSIPDEAKTSDAPQGVRTAIESFISKAPEPYILLAWNTEHGLGCVMRKTAYQPTILVARLSWNFIRWKNWLLRKLRIKKVDQGTWGRHDN